MENMEDLTSKVDKILREELREFGIEYDLVRCIVHDKKTVGVQGDEGTYSYVTEIQIRKNGRIVFNYGLMEKLSSRVTNEIREINRVVYFIASK